MNRRHFLATSAVFSAGGIAGCLGERPTSCYNFDLEPVNREQLIDEPIIRNSDLSEPRIPPLLADFVREVVDSGSGAIEWALKAYYPEEIALEWITYYDGDSGFYEIHDQTRGGKIAGPKYTVRRNEETPEDVPPDEVLAFDDLPRCDKLRLTEPYLRPDEAFHQSVDRTVIGGYLDPDLQAESVLATGVDFDYLQVEDGYAELDYSTDGTTTAKRFHYTSELVAESREAFVELHERKLQQNAVEYNDAERGLLDEAATSGFAEVCNTDGAEYDTAYQLNQKVGEQTYVQYDGQWYRMHTSAVAIDY